ncbi:MAG: O-antigen ligase family protein [bacterium]|nr:O-antigen ligase family protein [bacterium]
MPKTELYLSKIIKYGLYAILLTPLVFWPRALYAFGTPKFILFQVLVEIVFAAWLALLALRNTNTRIHTNDTNKNSYHSYDNSHYSYWKNWLIISLLVFIAVSFLSAIFGVDFSRSFWGIGARMTGLFTELHFFAWFLMLFTAFSNTNTRINTNNTNNSRHSYVMINSYYYLNFSFFVALAVAATAFYQNAGWTMAWGSTVFNNPIFVAPYLIFHFFWGLYQTLSLSNTNTRIHTNDTNSIDGKYSRHSYDSPIYSYWKNWFFGAGAAFIIFVILLGQVRGAILGLFAGILLLGFFLIRSDVTARRFKITLSIMFALIFIGIFSLWVFRDSQFIQNPNVSVLKRLTQFSLSEATAQTRILAWQTALKGFVPLRGISRSETDRPILGAGPENFNYVFNAHYNPSFLKFGGGGFGETWFDKPHNAFLEILTEIGIIGGLAYLFIWLAVVLALFKLFKSGQKILTLVLASAFLAYLGSIFFAFDSFGSWFGLFLFLAFLVSHSSNTNDNNNTNTRIYANDTNRIFLKNIFVLFVCIGLFVLLYVNYGIWRANIADADALRIFPREPAQGIISFKKSLSYSTPYKSEYQFDLIASVAGAVEKGMPLPNLEDMVNFSLGEADKAVAAHPKDAAKYTDMIRIYNILGTRGRDPEILAQAEAFGNKSLELSPQRQETLYYLARTALLKNDAKAAIIWAKQAVSADPDIKQSHWYLGLAYIANSQRQEGIAEIKKAIEMGYKPQNQAEANFIKSLGL